MTDTPVSPLRQRMIEDMTIRKLAPRTQQTYIRIVFAVRFREDKEGDCELRPLGVQFRCPGSRVQLDSQKLVGEALKLMRPGTAGDEASRGTAGSENDVFPRNMIFVARKCWYEGQAVLRNLRDRRDGFQREMVPHLLPCLTRQTWPCRGWYCTATDLDDRKRSEERIRNENLALREEIDRSSM
jgi:hypothetical protein